MPADRPNASPPSTGQTGSDRAWHTFPAGEVAAVLEIDPTLGLSSRTVKSRQEAFGYNVLADAKRVPAWQKLLRLLSEKMNILLILAAAVSVFVSRDWETPVVILAVIAFNTVLNFVQERRAESSLDALRNLTVDTSHVRRDGQDQDVDNAELVIGDIVLLGPGDTVPADGRLIESVRLQVAEAALTGESLPVEKSTGSLPEPDLPLGDRTNMVYMGTDIVRGRGVAIITACGMGTEMGRIAALLRGAGTEKTMLQRRIDHLARTLTIVAVSVVGAVVILGLVRGTDWSGLLLMAVSLAVATIPEGLPAVVAFTLTRGAQRLARRGAIIKQLSAVETLGSTTHIATDKTGTLTLNAMTVRRLVIAGRGYQVSGQGYSADGTIFDDDSGGSEAEHSDPTWATPLKDAFIGMALCNDASVGDGILVGDPTEGALVVLAVKAGTDVDGLRMRHPRVAEVPFDSTYKFMATFHAARPGGGEPAARYQCFVKGAPGILLKRAGWIMTDDGVVPLDDQQRGLVRAEVSDMAGDGLRTLLIAGRCFDSELPADPDVLRAAVDGLTVYALVGMADPPRPEAAAAVTMAQEAGIEVHMMTGDHPETASAIAAELGIKGTAVAGPELDLLDDAELARRIGSYNVLARVTPEHKIRVVRALQRGGNVVAVTGDGVNDAPALKQADIGIAMGVTGTDVAKGAAVMILTDDNFATIVRAVEEGRGLYANIIKFVTFQITTAWGFVLIFLAAGLVGLAGGSPFTALQILWVNIIMDGPPALALGVDTVDAGIMKQKPRPVEEPLLTRTRLLRILGLGSVMAAGTILVLALAPAVFPGGPAALATTLAFTTYVSFQVFNLLNVRSESRSVFSKETLRNRAIWISLAAVVVLQVLVVNLPALQDLFDTVALDLSQWGLSILVGSSVLWVEEVRKAVVRYRARSTGVLRG